MESKFQQRTPQKAGTDRRNLTGIPTQMKLDFEQRSGMSFDDVRVHYNSEKPAQFHALAYTQGAQIYIGPGQERSLSHELGHVIQQKAGRVRPTRWVCGQPVNDQPELEREADRAPVQCMAAPALRGVIQMVDVPVLPSQRGNNCGYHALARAMCSIYPCPSQFDVKTLEIELTTYAIQHGYSVIGEAFDPYILATVGRNYCEKGNFPIEFFVLDFSKSTNKKAEKAIATKLEKDESVFLMPYFSDENWGPGVNTNEENAHWCVIKKGDIKGQAKLYEGNKRGSTYIKDSAIHMQEALNVTLKQLIASNMSIKDIFQWDVFWNKEIQDPYLKTLWLEEINSMEAAVNAARKAFFKPEDLDKRVECVMSRISGVSEQSPYSDPNNTDNHIQKVHLAGHAIEVTRKPG